MQHTIISFISTDVGVSEGLHQHFAVDVHGPRAHGSQVASLVEVPHDWVGVHQLRRTTQVVVVRLFSPP